MWFRDFGGHWVEEEERSVVVSGGGGGGQRGKNWKLGVKVRARSG